MFETLKRESTPHPIGGCRWPPRQVESLELVDLVDRLEAGWKASQPNTGHSLYYRNSGFPCFFHLGHTFICEPCGSLCNKAIAKALRLVWVKVWGQCDQKRLTQRIKDTSSLGWVVICPTKATLILSKHARGGDPCRRHTGGSILKDGSKVKTFLLIITSQGSAVKQQISSLGLAGLPWATITGSGSRRSRISCSSSPGASLSLVWTSR